MKSTLRENHRYIGVMIMADGHMDRPLLQSAVRLGLLEKLGEIGFAKADPKLAHVGHDSTTAIIRCAHTEAESVRAGLSLITRIGQKKLHLMPVFTSGTILKCKRALAKASKL
ncbi:Ribonuclease P protein component 2 [uncultured archaeon]|nr:Ribonuclease P protein component 2 [uncultured archaeon]